MKELWEKALHAFTEEFKEQRGREPTEKDIDLLMPHYFNIYIGNMAQDIDLMMRKVPPTEMRRMFQ